METVSGTGFRNGSRPTNAKSYSNSLLHSLKSVIKDFNDDYDVALRNYAAAEYSLKESAVDKILEARQLREDGIITDEEFQQLKEKILSE